MARIEALGGSDVWEQLVGRLGAFGLEVGGLWFPVVVRGWRMKRERRSHQHHHLTKP
jgi:hypothetical protein